MSKVPDGYNPMRWNCSTDGCYNVKRRPKIQEFAACFPGRIGMGDVDGFVEFKRHFLFLEWKTAANPFELDPGQRIAFEQLTLLSKRITVIVICGDAETMEVSWIHVLHDGHWRPWERCSLADLKSLLKDWSDLGRGGSR